MDIKIIIEKIDPNPTVVKYKNIEGINKLGKKIKLLNIIALCLIVIFFSILGIYFYTSFADMGEGARTVSDLTGDFEKSMEKAGMYITMTMPILFLIFYFLYQKNSLFSELCDLGGNCDDVPRYSSSDISRIIKSAKNGDVDAINKIAKLYKKGAYFAKNNDKYLAYKSIASDLGDRSAAFELGKYFSGLDGMVYSKIDKKNISSSQMAFDWFLKGKEQGCVKSTQMVAEISGENKVSKGSSCSSALLIGVVFGIAVF